MADGPLAHDFDGVLLIEHSISLAAPAGDVLPALAEKARARGADVSILAPGRRLSARRGSRPRITIEDLTLAPTRDGTRLDYRIELALDGYPRDGLEALARDARGVVEADARDVERALREEG